MKTQVELLKESCDIKDAACVRYQKRIAELEKENENLNDYWNITQRTMKDYEDMIDELNDKLNKIKDLFNKYEMTGKEEFYNELRELLQD